MLTVKEKKVIDDMVECLSWAVANLQNQPIVNQQSLKSTTWHAWFRDVLKRSGAVDMEDE